MSIEALEGRSYPGGPYRLCQEKVAEFVAVTGDDRRRWDHFAPPGFAAALLFAVAPDLLADPLVDGPVIHGDQTFEWKEPLAIETELEVNGRVDRVRRRGAVAFVNFSFVASRAGEVPVVEGRSTFLVGASGEPLDRVPLPLPLERASTLPAAVQLPAARSASRADLVRYAAATRDWNPIHWDDASAVAAGLGGVVVHGLLQSAWLCQVAAASLPGVDHPLGAARFRFTAPLRPAEQATIEGDLSGESMALRLVVGDNVTVAAKFEKQ